MREQTLRGLFPWALAWTAFVPLMVVNASLLSMNPYPEGGTLHHLFEQAALWLPLVLLVAVAVWMLHRWRGLLRVSSSVPLSTTLWRLAIHGLAWFFLLLAGSLATMYLDYDPAQDHQGQYWPWALAAALLYATVPAPLGTLFTAWWSLRRKGGDKA
ncbi:hypothetical protein FJ251_10185 [bacterium]|nr:hypothetical protein [bacterium]